MGEREGSAVKFFVERAFWCDPGDDTWSGRENERLDQATERPVTGKI